MALKVRPQRLTVAMVVEIQFVNLVVHVQGVLLSELEGHPAKKSNFEEGENKLLTGKPAF